MSQPTTPSDQATTCDPPPIDANPCTPEPCASSMSQNVPQCPTFPNHTPDPSSPSPEAPDPSPEPSPAKPQRRLSPIQLKALALLAAGHTDAAIARKLLLNRRTLNRWRLFDPLFASRLNRLRKAIWANTLDRLRSLLPSSLAILARTLRSDNASAQLRAAIQLLKIAGTSRLATRIGPDNVSDILADRLLHHRQAEYSPSQLRTLDPPSHADLEDLNQDLLQHIAQEEAQDEPPDEIPSPNPHAHAAVAV